MVRIWLVLAFCGTVAGCATPQERTAQTEECAEEIIESTGSRVETAKSC